MLFQNVICHAKILSSLLTSSAALLCFYWSHILYTTHSALASQQNKNRCRYCVKRRSLIFDIFFYLIHNSHIFVNAFFYVYQIFPLNWLFRRATENIQKLFFARKVTKKSFYFYGVSAINLECNSINPCGKIQVNSF